MGGSTAMVVHKHFAVKVAKEAALDKAAPLMCAGVTMYEPLVMHKAGPGMTVGIAGCGGLGMMGIKLAVAMGADVYAISTTASKKDECLKMGCKGFILRCVIYHTHPSFFTTTASHSPRQAQFVTCVSAAPSMGGGHRVWRSVSQLFTGPAPLCAAY
jgi:D-arabinose 1-dehydrogenase-like Zn-dependent alcohol dehydrogenase